MARNAAEHQHRMAEYRRADMAKAIAAEQRRLDEFSYAVFTDAHPGAVEQWEQANVRALFDTLGAEYRLDGLRRGEFSWPPCEWRGRLSGGPMYPVITGNGHPLEPRTIAALLAFLEPRLPHFMVENVHHSPGSILFVRGMAGKSCPAWLAGQYQSLLADAWRDTDDLIAGMCHHATAMRALFARAGYPGRETPDYSADAFSERRYNGWRTPVEELKRQCFDVVGYDSSAGFVARCQCEREAFEPPKN